MKTLAKILLVGAAASALTACGGGGGGGGPSTGVTTPAPPPPPTTVPPEPKPFTMLLSPMAALVADKQTYLGRNSSTRIGFSDPDAPSATTASALLLDGDEDVRLQFTLPGSINIEQTFKAADYRTSPYWLGNGLTTRSWVSGGANLSLLPLEEGNLGEGTGARSVTDWVTPFQWIVPNGGPGWGTTGYGLIGDLATGAPTTGAARFRGRAVGFGDGAMSPASGPESSRLFSARAGVDIDFATGKVRGAVDQFEFPIAIVAPAHVFDFNFEASLVDGQFVAAAIDAPFQTGETGGVRGQLYGKGADLEVGGVFEAAYANARMAGVFVAGDPSSDQVSDPLAVRLRPSLANLISGNGGASASYNQNNIELGGNNEFLAYAANGLAGSDDSYDLFFDNGPAMVLKAFDAADYQGQRSVSWLVRPGANGLTRTLSVETWKDGQTLNRWGLAGQVDAAWVRPAYVQALEWVNEGISPGMTHRAYMTAGLRSASLPASGSARYKGEAFGTLVRASDSATFNTTASSTIDVFFDSGKVQGAFGFIERVGIDGTRGQIVAGVPGAIAFSGTLNANRAFDAAVTPQGAMTGHVRGDFYGPDGAELGAIYDINLPGLGAMAGMLVGSRNPFEPRVGYTANVFTGTAGATNYALSAANVTGLSLDWRRNSPIAQGDTLNVNMTVNGLTVNDSLTGRIDSTALDPTQRVKTAVFEGPNVVVEMIQRVAGTDLRYSSLAGWRGTFVNSPAAYVALGQRATDMPRTGKAEYKGSAAVLYQAPATSVATWGDAALSVDFAAGNLTGAITNVTLGAGRPDGNIAFSATIANAEFAGDFANADNSLKGPVKGLFAGPGATEAAGSFSATTAPAGTSYNGGFAVVKQ